MRRFEYKYAVVALAVAAIFMELLDSTIVNVAIPTLQHDLNVQNAATIQWVITGYLLSMAVFIPVSGWAGDRFGTKKSFLFALTSFSVGSMLCALAWDINSLIAFRVVQGIGGGMLAPVSFTLMLRAFPPEERSNAAAILVVPASVAPASGPIVGGLILQYLSWPWIFLVNVPIGLLGLVMSLVLLKEQKEENAGRFDVIGFALSATGLGSILFALSRAGVHGFRDVQVLSFVIAGVTLTVAFVAIESRIAEPMLDVRVFNNRLFRACSSIWLVTMFAFGGTLFLLTLELQAQRGLSALEAGFIIFTMALGVTLIAQPASRLYRVLGPQRMVGLGLAISGAAALAMWQVDLATSAWAIRGIMLLRGLGLGFLLVPLQTATYATISPAQTGRAAALYSATSQVASSLGVAVGASMLTNRLAHYGARLGSPETAAGALSAFQESFLLLGTVSLAATGLALFINDRDAAATMELQTERLESDDP